jgi:GNAT superfamily N-acetyltransferase
MEHARRASSEDLVSLAALLAAEHRELAAQRGGPRWSADARDISVEHLRAGLDDDRCVLFAGTIDHVVLGVARARLHDAGPAGIIAVIDDLYVDPEARQVGIGAALLGALQDWAAHHDCTGIDAVVLPGNRAAKNFFEAHGLVARAITVHASLRATQ